MPKIETQNFSNNIQCIEIIPLENGWQQWLLKSENSLEIMPSSNLILEKNSMPVLWQIDAYQFICIRSAEHKFQHQKKWNSFSITSNMNSKTSNQEANNPADYYLLICPGNSLFYAIHQIQIWRNNDNLPKNLILIAEANSEAAFRLQPSRIYSSLVPTSATASIALLDDWSVLCRFANENWQPGCYQGNLIELKNIIITLINNNTHVINFKG